MMSDEIYELDEMERQDEALPEQGFAYILEDPEDEDQDYHCLGMFDSDTEWISYNIPVEDALRPQRSDINIMMGELERRYE